MKSLFALVFVGAVSAAFWALLDQPLNAPDWQGRVMGLSYSPSHLYENDATSPELESVIRADMQHLSKVTGRVRTYSVQDGLALVPKLAGEAGLKVTLGLWLGNNLAKNETELARGITLARDYPNVVTRIMVGNEAVLRGELTPAEVGVYIKRVREGIDNKAVQIGTADVWGVWLQYPELAAESDFIGVHLLPYWDGIAHTDAMDYIDEHMAQMAKMFPNKPIVIAEAGWPSQGRMKQGSVPSASMEAFFVRNFAQRAAANQWDYYLIEAYDQPWKAEQEGAVGAYWGLFDAERAPKFAFTGPLTAFPEWRGYALTGLICVLLLGALVMRQLPRVRLPGYVMLSSVLAIAVLGAQLVFQSASLRYLELSMLGAVIVIVPALLFTGALLVTETVEWVLSLYRRDRIVVPARALIVEPRVSIHVPTHNEPPLMVMRTLNALAQLDYSNYEVIVLDNNTKDASLWKPVENHCAKLGANFRFFHMDGVKGFKAGALNKALPLTDPTAEFIALIDSDYQVAPDWLRTVVPAFTDDNVALVQAPQDYRDGGENLFKTICFEEYRAFFHVGMVERNEHNAIIQHGTMCVMRKSALEEVGGWGEWCITEDTELGLRFFEAGYKSHYIPRSLGRGVMPDTFSAYKAQRHRWVYGAMQIMKRHAKALFRRGGSEQPNQLTLAQRYHFVAGWMPWFADAFALIFGAMALVWTALMTLAPKVFDVPLTALSASALLLFVLKTTKTVALHRAKVGSSYRRAIGASLAGLSLAYTVGSAVLTGLFTSDKPFVVTPKCEDSAPWRSGLRMVATESMFLVAVLMALATMLYQGVEDPAEIAWTLALAVSAVPYVAALVVSLGSTVHTSRAPEHTPDVTAPIAPVPQPTRDMDLAA